MSHILIGAPAKETMQSVAVSTGVSVTALATVIIVALIASSGDSRYTQALQTSAFAGDVATVWSDVFDFSDEPRTFIASMRRIAEVNARSFKVGKIAILVSTLRADSKVSCQPLITFAGETPPRWDQALCPLRVRVTDTETGNVLTVAGIACMPPYSADDRSQTVAAIDVHAGTMTLSTNRDGNAEPACERTVHLPTPALALLDRM